ncbi:MAG: isocitrate lyase/phosphoenolpyruvate mutase family protein, partial [Thermomicrobiaceae bacterium]|nr:isocitrate lyase/phosphoenolpyruvate mutase family protein [Thermomicrobiaceae bacterium]
MSAGARLREALARPGALVVPGAVDALNARLVEEAGFDAVYATGAGIANALLGLPDLGLATMSEILEQVRRIVAAVSIPVVADVDTGYGNPLNVYRTVQEFERAGVAAIQIEDQVSPKRCGHFSGKEVIPEEEMIRKIAAAREARRDDALVLIARTDALATHGLDEAVRRGRAYAAAGADLIFVEAPRSDAELAALPPAIPAPLVANMTEGGLTPLHSAAELAAMGYKV